MIVTWNMLCFLKLTCRQAGQFDTRIYIYIHAYIFLQLDQAQPAYLQLPVLFLLYDQYRQSVKTTAGMANCVLDPCCL